MEFQYADGRRAKIIGVGQIIFALRKKYLMDTKKPLEA